MVTILKNTTKLVTDVAFPALTICGSGVHMSRVERKLVQDFKGWQAQNRGNGKKNESIKKNLEEFMEARFQIKPSQTGGEQPLTILEILDMMIAPDVDASVAANSVRENALACKRSVSSDSAYFCSDPRFSLYADRCFYVPTSVEKYADAVSACQGMGAELAKISSVGDDEMVYALRDGDNDVFIGMHKPPSIQSWVWQDGPAAYFNWIRYTSGAQEPLPSKYCVVKKYAYNGGWAAESCDAPKKYACRMAAENRAVCTYSCSDPRFTLLGNKCFYVSPAATSKVNYADAVAACKNIGANLAKITSLGEDIWVSAMRSGSDEEALSGPKWSPTATNGGLWIGMNDIENEGTWVWEDGSTVSQSFSNWIRWSLTNQEPNSDWGDCGMKFWRGTELEGSPSLAYGGWADTGCNTLRNYACSMPAEEESCDPEKVMEDLLHRRDCIQPGTNNNSAQENLPAIDIFLNPAKEHYKESIVKKKKKEAKDYFDDSDMKTLYPELFRLLWKSSLPCFKEEEEYNDEEARMLLSCELSGQKVNCSSIFTRVPTDTGICCALNVDNILRESEYQNLVKELQGDESINKVESKEGKRNGLKLFVDLHSNLVSLSTLDQQHNTFKLFVGEPAQFPMMLDKSLQVQPGREHFVDLSAKVVATNDIRHISPEARGCLFTDEGDLEFYKSYTFSNCRLECRIKEAEKIHGCIPWYLPKVCLMFSFNKEV